jgi:hypothetical protein
MKLLMSFSTLMMYLTIESNINKLLFLSGIISMGRRQEKTIIIIIIIHSNHCPYFIIIIY